MGGNRVPGGHQLQAHPLYDVPGASITGGAGLDELIEYMDKSRVKQGTMAEKFAFTLGVIDKIDRAGEN